VAKYNEASNVAIFELKDAVASGIPENIHGAGQEDLKTK
jgi:hypothetical protein